MKVDKGQVHMETSNCLEDPVFDEINEIEKDLILNAVSRRYGYDFKEYSEKLLRRRLNLFRSQSRVETLADLIPRLLHDYSFMKSFLSCLSITVTEFFRDPSFFLSFKNNVIPKLRTYPFITIWCAGCATGEEAYSWAILLKEEGLLERSRIYATDLNISALQVAKEGVYSEEILSKANKNYHAINGIKHFEAYARRSYGAFKMNSELQEHITFAQHNLVHDGVFGEMTMVSCRNVMIYFNTTLKQHCIDLFLNSLTSQGFLCLGESEAMDYSGLSHSFESLDKKNRIYQNAVAKSQISKQGPLPNTQSI